jgi:hypothetical protein
LEAELVSIKRTALLCDLARVYALARRDDSQLWRLTTSDLRREARRLGLTPRPCRPRLPLWKRAKKAARYQANKARRLKVPNPLAAVAEVLGLR